MGVIIKSFGHFIPDVRVTNAELAKRFGITEDWIIERTGIRERRYFTGGAVSDMVVMAAKACLEKARISPEKIDCLIVATTTPDYHCPSTASVVHQKLGTTNAAGFDLVATCSGYVYSLQLAASLINTKVYKNVLVCGGEKFSTVTNPADRKTVLIGSDGAGVSLLQYSETGNDIIDILCGLDGSTCMDVNISLGGSQEPLTKDNIKSEGRFLRFMEKRIFDNAIEYLRSIIVKVMEKHHITMNDIDFIVTHQANGKMIEILAQKFNLSMGKFIINIDRIGNTGAASIPIAISEALEKGTLKGNEKLLIATVGSGYTYAAGLMHLGGDTSN